MRAGSKLRGRDTERGAETAPERDSNCSRGPDHPRPVRKAPSSQLPHCAGSPQEPRQVNAHPLLPGRRASRGTRRWEPSVNPACTGPRRPRTLTTTGSPGAARRVLTMSSKPPPPRKLGAVRGEPWLSGKPKEGEAHG